MAVVDAWDFPGGDGDCIIMPPGLPHLRTGLGTSARTIIWIGRFNDLNQGGGAVTRGCLWGARPTAGGTSNHNVCVEFSTENLQKNYAVTTEFNGAAFSEVQDEWIAVCYCDNGNDGNRRIRRIPLGTGVQTHLAFFAGGGSSNISDSATQTFALGALYNDVSPWIRELDGQCAFFLYLNGGSLSQAECEAFALDPLAKGDEYISLYGSLVYFWDDSGRDVGPNNLGTPTLNGNATRGTGNGPDVPARPGAAVPTIASVGPYNDNIFVGEPGVEIVGSGFGVLQGAGKVYVNDAATLDGSEEEYTGAILWSDAFITMVDELAIGALTPGARYVIVESDTAGIGALAVTIQANPGENIGKRGDFPEETVFAGNPFSLDTSVTFFLDTQVANSLTFSLRSGAFPDGITLDPDGHLHGQIEATAIDCVSEVGGTDELGAFASDEFSWTITSGSRLRRIVTGPDLTRPTAPPGVSANQISQVQNNLLWGAAIDPQGHITESVSGVSGYRVYRDGALVSDQPGLSFSDTGLLPWTFYEYAVSAYDGAGNVSVLSPPVSIRTMDQTAPTNPVIAISATTTTSVTVALQTASTDAHSGMQHHEFGFKLNSASTWTTTNLQPGSFPQVVSGLTPGTSYDFRCRGIDNSNNPSSYSSVTVSTAGVPANQPPVWASNSPPTITFVKGAGDQVYDISQYVSDPDTPQSGITITKNGIAFHASSGIVYDPALKQYRFTDLGSQVGGTNGHVLTADDGGVQVNQPPVWTTSVNQSLTVGTLFTLNLDTLCSDPEFQPLTYTILSGTLPVGLMRTPIPGRGNVISGTPTTEGPLTVTFRATD